MKIAICGSAGTGKTTLATALARDIGCGLVEEGYDAFFDDGCNYINPPAHLRQSILSVLESKDSLENEFGAFVSDRCAVDLFNLWMSQGFGVDAWLTARFYDRCRACIVKYDRIVVLPWSAVPLTQHHPHVRRRRTLNPWFQLHNHANIIGLLHQWVAPARLLPVPFDVVGIERRVAFVSRKLADD